MGARITSEAYHFVAFGLGKKRTRLETRFSVCYSQIEVVESKSKVVSMIQGQQYVIRTIDIDKLQTVLRGWHRLLFTVGLQDSLPYRLSISLPCATASYPSNYLASMSQSVRDNAMCRTIPQVSNTMCSLNSSTTDCLQAIPVPC